MQIALIVLPLGMTVVFVMAYAIHVTIKKPLERLTNEASRTNLEDCQQKYSGLKRTDEIGDLTRSFSERDARYRELVETLENRVLKRTESLEEAKEAADRANNAKSVFLANMSHEIRTPLNGVLGMTQVLSRSQLDQNQSKFVKTIDSSGRLLLSLINDILDLSKIESDELEYEEINFSLSQLLNDLHNQFKYSAQDKKVDLEFYRSANLVDEYCSDPAKITQIINNLLSNAIKFTPKGNVTLEINVAQVEGRICLVFIVTDTGIGISEEALQKIFNPFTQADPSTTRKYGGTGLGLAISKRIAEGFGGTLEVESELGTGTCFTCSIPVKPALSSTENLEQQTA